MHLKKSEPDQSTAAHAASPEDSVADAPDVKTTLNFLAPAEQPGELGRLGHYRILKTLGKGGMGVVFLAQDMKLERQVALKVMLPRFAEDANAKRRFLREAKTAAAIEHDHIVHIYQVGEDRGVPFLAMQLLSGLSLEEVLQRAGRLTVPQILRVGSQIAEGLAVAHAKNLIHRDIKPANIWIEANYGGRVKLLDFGLARTVQTDVGITQLGTIVGTPAYMPPEQARGDRVDLRCDLYALGCVLYRMATGELPFKGKDTMALLTALALNDPTPPKQLNDTIPEALNNLILKLLAKDADRRPESAKSVAAALRRMEQELTGTTGEGRVADELAALAQRPNERDDSIPAARNEPSSVSGWTVSEVATQQGSQPPTARRRPSRRYVLAAAVAGLAGLVAFIMVWRMRNDDPVEPPGDFALHFGQTDRVVVRDLPHDTPKTVTIEARIKCTGKGTGVIAHLGGRTGFTLARWGNSSFAFGVHRENDTIGVVHVMEIPNRYVHIAGVWDGFEPALFIDGKRVGEQSRLEDVKSEEQYFGSLRIGAHGDMSNLGAAINMIRISSVPRYDRDFTFRARFKADDDTYALYLLDEGQGDVLKDSSGSGRHGKITGAQWTKADETPTIEPIPWLPSYRSPSKYALAFDGKASHVTTPTFTYDGEHPLTIEVDVKPTKVQSADFISDGITNLTWQANVGPPRFHFGLGTRDKNWLGATASVDRLPDDAVHLAGVVDQDEMRVYLNGRLAERRPLAGYKVAASVEALTLGAHGWLARARPKEKDETRSFLNYFEGHIQRVRISKVARYDQDFTPAARFEPDKDTLVLYQFDEGKGDKLIDSSGNAHHGKIHGAKWVNVDGTPISSIAVPGQSLRRQFARLVVDGG